MSCSSVKRVDESRGRTRRSFLATGAAAVFGAALGDLARPFGRIDRPRRALGSGTRARREARRPEPAPARDRLLAVRGLAPAGHGPALERFRDRLHARRADQRLRPWSTHAVAALRGTRATAGATSAPGSLRCGLCKSPPFRPRAQPADPALGPALGEPAARARVRDATSRSPGSSQHITVDPKVARALYYAWRAREQLKLPPATVARLVARVRAVAFSPFFRYPNIRLNQINFAAELHACAASMTGDATLLRRDYRSQLGRFLDGAEALGEAVADREPRAELQLPPQPVRSAPATARTSSRPSTRTSCWTSSTTTSRRGAPAWRRSRRARPATLRAWVKRALPAYWTHSGYLNWDTGLYLYRWHLSRYWAWSCQGLLAIASSQNFVNAATSAAGRSTSSTARWRCTSASASAGDRRPPRAGQLSLYGITTKFSEGPHFELARFQALAAEAVLRASARRPSEEPPPLYAFDPLIGRLTVTTPSYNTALVAVSNGAFPYGGIELARLYDASQRVVSHIGGRAPAGFGLVVRAPGSKIVAASQRARGCFTPAAARPPAAVASGAIHRGTRYPPRPYAGRFAVLEAEGFAKQEGIHFHSNLPVPRRPDRDRLEGDAQPQRPALGRGAAPELGDAVLNVTLKSGQRSSSATRPTGPGSTCPRSTTSTSTEAGSRAATSRSRALRRPGHSPSCCGVGKQSSNPRPGPSIAVRLAPRAGGPRSRSRSRSHPPGAWRRRQRSQHAWVEASTGGYWAAPCRGKTSSSSASCTPNGNKAVSGP